MRFRVTIEGGTDDDVTAARIADFINDAIAEEDDRRQEDGEPIPGFIGNARVELLPE